ncbi:MAG TPA: hypothetical protein VII92_15570 [Anaerolineae bacterium]
MAHRTEFKRMVLGLPLSVTDYEMVGVTAKLAELLRLTLVAMYVEDHRLIDIASLPCVRELRALGGGWQPIEVGQLTTELEHAAITAHRLFSDIARNCNVETSFRIERGSAADVISSLATAEDIVVIIEPKHPVERVTQQFTRLIDAAFQASAAVMIIPCRVARLGGPIVAVAANPDDPSIGTAMGIAAAAHEKLIVVSSSEQIGSSASLETLAESAGVRVQFVRSKKGPLQATALADNLQQLNERLIVISRGTLADAEATTLASLRSTPVVIVEPDSPASINTR